MIVFIILYIDIGCRSKIMIFMMVYLWMYVIVDRIEYVYKLLNFLFNLLYYVSLSIFRIILGLLRYILYMRIKKKFLMLEI